MESFFERQERLSWWRQDVLRAARIMVVGAGALGNETLKNLALLGVRWMLVVDQDDIAPSNLSRTVLFQPSDIGRRKAKVAAERTQALCRDNGGTVRPLDADLVWDIGLGVFRRVDVILGCVDNDEARLAINRAARAVGIPWINAGMHELTGSVTSFSGEAGACFECAVTPDQVADAQSRYDSCEQVRRRYLVEERLPTIQVTSALTSALQVQEALKVLHREPVNFGVRYVYNGLTHGFHAIQLPYDPHCLAHGRLGSVVELPIGADASLRQTLDVLEAHFGHGVTVHLDRRYIRRIGCRRCGRPLLVQRPAHRIYDDELVCADCPSPGDFAISEAMPQVATADSYIEIVTCFTGDTFGGVPMTDEDERRTLRQLGIPPLHILTVEDRCGRRWSCELTGDVATVLGDWGVETLTSSRG
ncbi:MULTISPECIES: HesA/MoeB/ThiF family protein [Chloracidobacterium]|jgi:molybdopterin/thiamine biosynthesis adenylyltransferase|uniref:Dinucleotide-utilizing enzymes involved in molybdopterin and thiamine biosynthesis family 2 n=1 Tax=Chloracidobacterium thermophilum (strain B) TaxID=981222 RepID=G2LGE7_CHLTF|nr:MULTISPECIES: ThiF family adenylyltransferase [Chloracidobacterium]AEP10907.1 Dinucleotide-utilizing enzymes involved in molybdopterin and thiamine biosynthesis family 2 [Chloracidobacterium thermophilum B]QUV78835.1 ThiF family adenylyltransferase [Chloracidobacterium thermophilum]QUV81884.1 ThiF family adenylyltransferase [Chloracidobacterium sp. D]